MHDRRRKTALSSRGGREKKIEPCLNMLEIRKGRLHIKRLLHIRQLSLAGFAVFVTVFFPFLQRLYFAICRKNLLVQFSVIFVHILLCPFWITPWHRSRGEKKNWSAGSLFPIPLFLPASAGGSTAKTTRNSHKWTCSQTGLSFIWG